MGGIFGFAKKSQVSLMLAVVVLIGFVGALILLASEDSQMVTPLVVALGVGALVAFLIVRSIRRPITALTVTMLKLSSGDTAVAGGLKV